MAWVLLSYTTALDLGLGRATTKFAAEYLGRGEHEKLSGIVWTSVWAQAILGLIGAILAAAATPLVVERLLKISASLQYETKISFFLLAASLPVVLIGNTFRGLLEAGQRFDLVNYVRIPANASIFLLPALALPLRIDVPGIVLLLVFARLAATAAYLAFCLKQYPALRGEKSGDPRAIRTLLVYGGWVTVSNAVSPLMMYLDRFFIGSMISMAAVGYYTAPYEAISRATVFPSSLTATIFPAFSSLDASGSQERLEELCVRSLKSLLLALAPILFLVVFFAREILNVWLGPDFGASGTLVLQVLAAGALINSLAFVPLGLLHGLGRPDLSAKFHLLELPLYIAALAYLLKHMGIAGAALAWTLRVSLDAVLLYGAVLWLRLVSADSLIGNGLLKSVGVISTFGMLLGIPWLVGESAEVRSVLASVVTLAFGFVAWTHLLDSKDRNLILSAPGQLRAAFARAK
jgi:O-antigen/teichoic acid export membrane protein